MRFPFGRNWKKYVAAAVPQTLETAEASVAEMFGRAALSGKTFLDVGAGSGLFSLAASRLGARRVLSFDYDAVSVLSARELKNKFAPAASAWDIEQGSILDDDYVSRLGKFDFVYAWGSLHHTGDMPRAMENVARLVAPGGYLAVAVYNYQGWMSRVWLAVKKMYNALPFFLRPVVLLPTFAVLWFPSALKDFFRAKPFATWRNYRRNRGMSPWRDVVDWAGGYPFETARPEDVFDFFKSRGFALEKMRTVLGGHGCNEFVFFRKIAPPPTEKTPL